MLHRIRDIDAAPVDTRTLERSVERAPGRSGKGDSGSIFLVSWLFPDQHQCVGSALAEDRLRSTQVEIAAPTASVCLLQGFQACVWGTNSDAVG